MMTDVDINEVVTRVLRHRLHKFGFAGSRVLSEIDFDGSPIIRVIAQYKKEDLVPSNKLVDSLEDIRSELIQRGEERFVFLDNEYPGEEEDEETE